MAAVKKLERLDEEFDLANAAGPKLDVSLLVQRTKQLALDPRFHLAELLDCAEVEIAPVDERLDLAQKTLAEHEVAGDRARFDQRRALPGLSPAFIIN